ncbi:uncharacterized protein J3R85_003155 [Psidium guajava]|nr:uncharacterized protein J3R85_003155 [Psidium guajava]
MESLDLSIVTEWSKFLGCKICDFSVFAFLGFRFVCP